MKKKKWLILSLIIIAILVLGIICVKAVKDRGICASEAIYIESKYGPAISIDENRPILISNKRKHNLFDNLETGDNILVVHDDIIEAWPGRTRTYAVFKRNEDEKAEISPSIMDFLITYEWLEPEKNIDSVGWDGFCSSVELKTFDEICEWSDTIVKAKYIKRENFDLNEDIFIFEVEEDYIGNVDEKQIHVYDTRFSSFVKGKSYYLCMSSMYSPLYPHVVYRQTRNSFHVGEIEKGDSTQYTFYSDYTWGLDNVDDISRYIKTEIVEKGIYVETEKRYSLEEAIENADAIYKIEIESVEPETCFVAIGKYWITDKVRELYPAKKQKEVYSTLVPADAKPGDKYIVLGKYNEEYQTYGVDFSTEHSIYPLNSPQARYIIRSAKIIKK